MCMCAGSSSMSCSRRVLNSLMHINISQTGMVFPEILSVKTYCKGCNIRVKEITKNGVGKYNGIRTTAR